MRLSLVVNMLLVVAVATTVIGVGLFTNLLAVPGGAANASPTPPPNTGPLPTFTPTPSPLETATPSPAPTVRPSLGGTYIVQPGDNLTIIANKYGISVAALIAANPQLLPPNYIIHADDVLNIPNPGSKCGDYEAYTVQTGDFLVKIGEKYSVSPTDIADFNSLPFPGRQDYSDIRPGDVLCIPEPGWTPLATAAATP
ncbi:MAG: LysM peptidoglycan-binding domain-containing protein [Chloroflexota bacterium]